MNESSYMTLLGKLEHSDNWGFGDAFELLCDHTNILAKAFDAGRTGFDNTFTALMDVWTTVEDSISLGEIRVKSGRLIDLAGGLLMTENPNVLVLDKESFLAWYRRDKEKIAQYLSCVDLKIYQEEFLDRLAKSESPKHPHPTTDRAKKDRLREDYSSSVAKKLKKNPSLQYPDFKDDYGLQKLIRGSGLPEDKLPAKSTFQEWIRQARKTVKAKPKPGASKKAKKLR